jgi:NADPH:quinone reductase-like Zn-dependent oxidoreductase
MRSALAFQLRDDRQWRAACGVSREYRESLGSELSGIVEAVGDDGADFRPGDEVYGAICDAESNLLF